MPGKLEGEREITLGFVRDDFIEKDRSRGIYYFAQDWVSMPGVLPVASGRRYSRLAYAFDR